MEGLNRELRHCDGIERRLAVAIKSDNKEMGDSEALVRAVGSIRWEAR